MDLSRHPRDRVNNYGPKIRHGRRIGNAEVPECLFNRSQESRKPIELTGNIIGQNVGIMDSVVDRLVQRIHPITEGSGKVRWLGNFDIGLRLADDTTHVLSAVDSPFVARAVDVAFAAAGDTPDIIAQPGIAHRFSAHTVFNKALVVSADTAGIRSDARSLCGQTVEEVQQTAGIDVVKLQTGINAFRIDIAAAVAGNQRPVVYAADTADLAQSGYIGSAPAACDNSGYFIASHQSACLQFPGDRPTEGAVQDTAPVQSHQPAGHIVVSTRYDDAGDREVFYDAVHAGFQEEAAGRQRICQTHVKYAVSATVEAAVEKRDRLEIHVRKREVIIQHHRKVI